MEHSELDPHSSDVAVGGGETEKSKGGDDSRTPGGRHLPEECSGAVGILDNRVIHKFNRLRNQVTNVHSENKQQRKEISWLRAREENTEVIWKKKRWLFRSHGRWPDPKLVYSLPKPRPKPKPQSKVVRRWERVLTKGRGSAAYSQDEGDTR